jgi:hypothetical protein
MSLHPLGGGSCGVRIHTGKIALVAIRQLPPIAVHFEGA